ncbi:hypothetical protein ACE6H2_014581 [Prunus campanulata]
MNPISVCSSSSSSSGSWSSTKAWIVHGIVAGVAIAVAIGARVYLGPPKKFRSRVVGIIPARFASSRFQGKPLVQILGKPMIQYEAWSEIRAYGNVIGKHLTYKFELVFAENMGKGKTGNYTGSCWCVYSLELHLCNGESEFDQPSIFEVLVEALLNVYLPLCVVIATDDEKIRDCCRSFGADVIMTSESCRNGTERCSEAIQKLEKKYDIVVNIQGDEPLIEPEIIDGIVKALQEAPDAVFSTAVTSLKLEDAFDPNRVKCVVDNSGYAIYFSRGLIPFNKSGKANPQFPYMLHLGIQSYDTRFLKIYPQLEPTPLQLEEDLEQLKVLENGYKMKVIKVDHEAHGVDTPEDVEKIESLMHERNLS